MQNAVYKIQNLQAIKNKSSQAREMCMHKNAKTVNKHHVNKTVSIKLSIKYERLKLN
jgi:hypothetical protein